MAGGRIAIEICGNQNQDHVFPPAGIRVRGRKDSARFPQRGRPTGLSDLLAVVPVIPGKMIVFDSDKSTGHIFDPLRETDEGKKLWKEIESIVRRNISEFGPIFQLEPPQDYELFRTPEEGMPLVKDWLWSMVRAVQGGHARVAVGSPELPTLDQIKKMPGHRTKDVRCTLVQVPEDKRYVDIVPAGGKKQPAA